MQKICLLQKYISIPCVIVIRTVQIVMPFLSHCIYGILKAVCSMVQWLKREANYVFIFFRGRSAECVGIYLNTPKKFSVRK
jgi:biotin transporter BioY